MDQDQFDQMCQEAIRTCQDAFEAMKVYAFAATPEAEQKMKAATDRFYACHKQVMDAYRVAYQESRSVEEKMG